MRIAIKTEDPLPGYKCWYAFEEDRVTTVASLAKMINKELDLADKSGELVLLHDDFAFLPSSLVKGLIREDNLITIRKIAHLKQGKKESKQPKEKRKKEVEKKTEKKKQAKQKNEREKDKQKKKPKEEESKKRKTTLTEEEGGKSKKKVKTSPQPHSDKVKANDCAVVKQQQKQQEKQEQPQIQNSEQQPRLSKSQKRNRRKAINNRMQRQEASAIIPTPEQEPKHEKEVTMATPEHLLKKNKNKKKDFLKEMAKKPRAHIHFDKEEVVSTGPEEQEPENLYGAAYVTAVETDPDYDGEQKNWAQYPVHQVKSHFYADAPPPEEDQQMAEQEEEEEEEEEEAPPPPPVVNREYETLPKASLTEPSMPKVGDLLAIKTLSMTEFYTPEISDWKEVKVSSVGEECGETVITVEYQPGFLLKKAHGRFELPDEDDQEEEDEGQESEYAKNQIRVYSASDLVDMRKL